jgi:hypothetical protein
MSSQDDYDHGLHSKQPSANFQYGSQQWEGALAAEHSRARQARWEQQQASERTARERAAREREASIAQVATRSDGRPDELGPGRPEVELGPGAVVALEAGILSCFALYRNWPQYLSLYSSFPQINVLWEYGVAAGLVLLSAIFYVWVCRTSTLFTWVSFIVSGGFLAGWSLPWGLNWQTCLAGFLVVIMFIDRCALTVASSRASSQSAK